MFSHVSANWYGSADYTANVSRLLRTMNWLGVWKYTCNLEVTYVTKDTTPRNIVNGHRVA
jgi:hypothetical protein